MEGLSQLDHSGVLMLKRKLTEAGVPTKTLQGLAMHACNQRFSFPPIFQALHQAPGMQMRHSLPREAFSVENRSVGNLPLAARPKAQGNT